jgi:hypothetical protein
MLGAAVVCQCGGGDRSLPGVECAFKFAQSCRHAAIDRDAGSYDALLAASLWLRCLARLASYYMFATVTV